jgi:triphosphoribosyl-dephospho-CoA synthase
MGIAAHRDQIACAYVNSFSIVFDLAIPRYDKGMSVWGDEEWATVAVFAALLIAIPDSHIERKFGTRFNRYLADKLSQVEQALCASAKPETVLPLLRNVDAELKSQGLNPGTSADLTVACLLSVRLERLLKGCGQRG